MAVVAMGKAGGREMMAGSDLDLMLIYDHPAEVTRKQRRAGSLPVSQWFVRAGARLCRGGDRAGRGRPALRGRHAAASIRQQGPGRGLARRLPPYHAESAWTWERMALTRARVVAGPPALRARIEAAIAEALAAAGEPDRIRADAASMRARMLRDLPPDGAWDVKLRAGGQIEVEFIAQVLQLIHARDAPGLCSPTTRVALARLPRPECCRRTRRHC